IGITDVSVPEVGRQGGKTRFYLEPTAVPVQQGLHGKAMTEVVQPRSAAGSWTSQPDLPRSKVERAVHVSFVQAVARARRKYIGRGASFQEALALLQIFDKDFPRGRMNGHQTRLPELGFLNRQHVVMQIDIVELQVHRFSKAKTCYAQQSEQTVILPAAQASRRRQRSSSRKEPLDLLVGIDVWPGALRPIRQQRRRRYLSARIDRA